jgi:two-component system response regulator YesN
MKKPLILLVDDDQEVTKSFSETILDTGKYGVIAVNSAKDAFDAIKNNKTLLGIGSNKIKLILLDIRMPGMSGIEFLDKLKREIDSRIDVIMVTAFDDDDYWADTFFSHDIVSFITKPIDRKGLIETIDSYFRGEKDELRRSATMTFTAKNIAEEIENTKKEIGQLKGSLPKEGQL